MPYRFDPKRVYRMPTHFGPSLGPRQGIEGKRYDLVDGPRQRIFEAVLETEPDAVDRLLPRGFSAITPARVSVSFVEITQISWLAGRGYNTFGISAPVRFEGETDQLQGDFLFVLWENMADPIITGREELGFSKVYCELPPPRIGQDYVTCRAHWDGFEFAQLRLQGETDTPLPDPDFDSAGTLHLKYMPTTGAVGHADACYPVLTPAANPNFKILTRKNFRSGQAIFNKARWEDLPTLYSIVNTLAELPMGPCIAARQFETVGFKDLSDQRRLS